MSWAALAIFTVGNIITRALGMFALGGRVKPDSPLTKLMALVPIAVVAAVFAVQTFSSRDEIVFDSRILGVAAASLAVWRKAPMVVVVLVAAGVTGGARALGLP
ncbi:MAG: AzlD domain-containing protein [Acidimicrobiales bacterium]|nr:AzlD domain-containing protein [Acidimicrobiales bacterium]